MYRARGPPLPRIAANDSKGGDHMADLLHGFAEVLTTPVFAVMILTGIVVGKLTKHR